MTTEPAMTVQALHNLPDDVLLTATLAARLLNLTQPTFNRFAQAGLFEEARFEPTPRAVRYWKRKLIEAAVVAGGKRKALAAMQPRQAE